MYVPESVARLHDAHGGQRPQPRADARPADTKPYRQIALGRQAIARAELTPLNQPADVRHDLFGYYLVSGARTDYTDVRFR